MMSVLFFNISRGFGYGNAIPLSQATCGICDTATTAADSLCTRGPWKRWIPSACSDNVGRGLAPAASVSHLRASDISDRSFSVVTEPTEL